MMSINYSFFKYSSFTSFQVLILFSLLQQKKTAFKDTVEKTSAIFYQKQNELKVFEKSLKEYKRIILNVIYVLNIEY